MPSATDPIDLLQERRLDRRTAACHRSPSPRACRGTATSVGSSCPETDEARPRSTSARYSRARRCGGGTRKLDHMLTPFAPVSTASSTSVGKNRGSSAAGAWYATFR